MGVQLMVEVLDHAPDTWTPSERLTVVAIAESIRTGVRRGCPPVELIAHRVGIDAESLSKNLRRLAAKGWELRVPTGVDRKGRTVYAHRGHRTMFQIPPLCPRGEHSTYLCASWATADLGLELEAGDERPDHRPAIATHGDEERGDHRPAITPESPDHRPPFDVPREGERPDHRPAKVGERPDHRPLKAGPPSGPSPISPKEQSPIAASPSNDEPNLTEGRSESDTDSESPGAVPPTPPAAAAPVVADPQPTNGTVVGHLVPGASRKARRNGAKPAKVAKPPKQAPRPVALFPKTAAKPPEAVQIIWDDLRRRGNPHATQDDARAVLDALRAQYGDKVKPPYLRGIAGNTGFGDHFAAIKAARAPKVQAEITRLRATQPECEHGTGAGKTPHPTTGLPLCPQCRAGHAPTADDGPTTPAPVIATLDAYRATYQGHLTAEQLVTLTQQATGLHRRGADPDALTALARRAGQAGVQLLTAATQGGTP